LYAAEINRRQPACLLLLIDQSYSMSERWAADGTSLLPVGELAAIHAGSTR
jgi:hypothetical protein